MTDRPVSEDTTPPGLTGDIDVLAFAAEEMAAGRRVALVTIVGLDGPFSRPLGAQIAVSEDRRFVGSISGGCLEQALTEEAQGALADCRNRLLRYGSGSPYLDVRLPCGGGIDLLVDAGVSQSTLKRAVELGRSRQTFSMAMTPRGEAAGLRILENGEKAGAGEFVRRFDPKLRLLLAGRGWEIVAMTQMARTADCEIVVASQEAATLDYCKPYADELIALTTPARTPPLPLDASTAVACLFHEHEWEAPLLLDALRSEAFYVGALGSRQTHERRVHTLRELGAGPDDIEKLKGPIGLFPTRDPRALAVSALAEIFAIHTARVVA